MIYPEINDGSPKPWPRPGKLQYYESEERHADEDEEEGGYTYVQVEQQQPHYQPPPPEYQYPAPRFEERDDTFKYILLLLAGLVAVFYFTSISNDKVMMHKTELEQTKANQISIYSDLNNQGKTLAARLDAERMSLNHNLINESSLNMTYVNGVLTMATKSTPDSMLNATFELSKSYNASKNERDKMLTETITGNAKASHQNNVESEKLHAKLSAEGISAAKSIAQQGIESTKHVVSKAIDSNKEIAERNIACNQRLGVEAVKQMGEISNAKAALVEATTNLNKRK